MSFHVILTRHVARMFRIELTPPIIFRPTKKLSSQGLDHTNTCSPTSYSVSHSRSPYMNLYGSPHLFHSNIWSGICLWPRQLALYGVCQEQQRTFSSAITPGRISFRDGISLGLGTIWPLVCVQDSVYIDADICIGDVWWLNEADATSQHLAYINSANNAIIKVDNTSDVPFNQKRNTVRAFCSYPEIWAERDI